MSGTAIGGQWSIVRLKGRLNGATGEVIDNATLRIKSLYSTNSTPHLAWQITIDNCLIFGSGGSMLSGLTPQQDFLGGQNHFSIKPENVHFWCFPTFHKPFATVSQPHRPPPHNFSPGFWMFHRYHVAGRPISKATIQK